MRLRRGTSPCSIDARAVSEQSASTASCTRVRPARSRAALKAKPADAISMGVVVVVPISPMRSGLTPPTKKPLTAEGYRDLDELREMRPGLEQRIAAALPASGRGRPSRPTANAVWRGVLARCCRAEGLPDAVIAAEVALGDGRAKPYAIETLRKWERAVCALERAEGSSTPDLDRDPQALRRVREALAAYGRRSEATELGLRRDVEAALAAAGGRSPNPITAALAADGDRQAEIEQLAADQAAEAKRDQSRRFAMPGSRALSAGV